MKMMCTCTRVLCAATISIRECGPLLLERYFYARRSASEHDQFAVCLLKPRAVKVGTSLENCSVRFGTF